MNKNILSVLILITGILVVGAITSPVAAQTDGQATPKISYPIAELGNCTDKTTCKVYCDKPANVDACLSFAEKNNLMSKEEIKVAKNFKKSGMTGPGGCKGKDECKTYCGNPDHMDECVTFAENNGLMSGGQLEEAKKVKAAINKGIKPPACGGKETCDAYCSSSEHVEECVKFGEAAGIIRKEDAEKIRKAGGRKGTGSGNGPDGQQGQGQGQGQGGGPGGQDQGPGGSGGPGPDQGQGGPGGGGPGGQGGQGGGPGGGRPDEQGNGGPGGPGQRGNGGGERGSGGGSGGEGQGGQGSGGGGGGNGGGGGQGPGGGGR